MPTTAKVSPDILPPTILIAAGTPADLAMATEHLERDGYRVVAAQSSEDAIERARLLRPDLILLDVTLAGTDGFGTCRRLKADERTGDMPVIFMTSLTQVEQKVAGFDSGAVDYVTKPLQSPEILARVRTHVTLRRLQRQVAVQNGQLQQEIAAYRDAEEAVCHAREELDRRVEARTTELAKTNEMLLVEIAERKQAESALRKAVDDVRDLYNKAPCGYHSLNEDGVFVAINDTELQWLGYTREEIIGTMVLPDLLTPEGLPVFLENFPRLKQRGWVRDLEFQFVRKDGTILSVLLNATAIKDDEGNFVMSRSTLHDITERKCVEEALRKSQRDYEALVNTIDGIVWEVDVKTFEFLFVSQKAERLLGYPLAEWFETPNAWFKHLHPEDREGAISFCVTETKAKRDHVFEYRMIAADGRVVWLQDFVNVMVENGEPAKLRGVMVDITERKQAEQALQESERNYRSVVTAMAEGIVIQAATGEITAVNPAAERIEGRSAAQMMGRTSDDPCWQSTYEDGRPFPGDLHPSMVTLRTGQPQTDVVMGIRRPDGTPVWISINSQPLVAAEGSKPYAVVTTFHDITERKRAEDALHAREEEFRALAENSPDVICRYARDCRLVYANPSFETLLGISLPEMLGKTRLEIYPSRADVELYHAKIRGVLETGVPVEHELLLDSFPGEVTRCHYIRLVPERDRCGQIVSVLAIGRDITPLKDTERKLRDSELRFREMFDNTSESIFMLDVTAEGRFRFAGYNPVAERVSGLSAAQVIGKCIDEVSPPDLARVTIPNFQRCVEAGTPISYEEQLGFPAGRGHFHTTLIPVRDQSGRIYRIVGIARDITGEKQAEDALRRNEADLQLALDAGRLGDWKWNIATGEIAWSARCKALYGLAPDTDINAERFLASVHPDDRDRIEAALKRAVETRTDYESEKRVIWPGGSVRWNASRGRVFCDAGGQPVLMAGVSMDITERKQAEESLRHSQQLLQAIIDNSTAVIYVKDLEGRFLLVNRRFTDLFHLTRETVVGKTDHDFFPKDRADAFRVFDQKVLAAGTVLEEEEVAPQDDGLHTYISIKCPLYDAADQPYAVCGISTDITERKRAEDALQATMARILQQESALITLTGKESMRSDKLLTSLHRISEMSARTLDVARVSVWRYNQDRSAIRCVDLYEFIENRHSAGAELTVNDCPAYFQALAGCDAIAADDAQNEPRTCEFSTSYLKPLGITSMMDSPIQLRGVLEGVVCHEHVGPLRKWTSDERTFVIAIANLVSLALEESERRQAEAQIKSSLKEKELLLKEVHHRVKNNLQVVSSLLNWQASYIEDASVRSIFKDSQNRVRSMALIHEKLYQSEDLAHIDFRRYVQSLTANLFHSYGVDANRIRLAGTIDDASLDIDTAIPCGMILNELVSNALKHAFPNGRSGKLHVELRPCAPDRLTLVVSDDGVGLPAELNVHATPSLGLQLVVTLTEQLKGNVEVNRNNGTQFQITFPVPKSKERS